MVKKAKLNQLLKDLELNDLRHRQIAELSGGQLQRVLVARALMSNSDIYCLIALMNHLLGLMLKVKKLSST